MRPVWAIIRVRQDGAGRPAGRPYTRGAACGTPVSQHYEVKRGRLRVWTPEAGPNHQSRMGGTHGWSDPNTPNRHRVALDARPVKPQGQPGSIRGRFTFRRVSVMFLHQHRALPDVPTSRNGPGTGPPAGSVTREVHDHDPHGLDHVTRGGIHSHARRGGLRTAADSPRLNPGQGQGDRHQHDQPGRCRREAHYDRASAHGREADGHELDDSDRYRREAPHAVDEPPSAVVPESRLPRTPKSGATHASVESHSTLVVRSSPRLPPALALAGS